MRGIAKKVAIISGGASSIGAEIARAFVAQGASVVLADVDVAAGEAFAAELGERALFARTDLASDADIRACVDASVERFGRIDFLVNAAAVYQDEGPASVRAHWARCFDVNVTGPVMLALAARPHLAKVKGAIVNIGSISASVAQSGRWT